MKILKNPCFTAIPDVGLICEEYFLNINIHFFGHITVFPNGKFHFLCSKHDWPEYGYVKEKIPVPPAGFTIYEKIKDSINFPSMKTGLDLGWSDEVMKTSYEQFKIKNPMVIFRKYSEHFEGFLFDIHDAKPYEKYLNNFDLFENFLFYYKDKAKDLIQTASQNQLQVHEKYLNKAPPLNSPEHSQNIKEMLLPKQYLLNHNGLSIAISPREYECLSAASHGKKIKGIAASLNLSYRTIETHLNSLKQKLNVSNLDMAIEIYWKNRILGAE